jgi:hypothetical protein
MVVEDFRSAKTPKTSRSQPMNSGIMLNFVFAVRPVFGATMQNNETRKIKGEQRDGFRGKPNFLSQKRGLWGFLEKKNGSMHVL